MLPKKYRLTKHGSFNYVYRRGTCFHSGSLTLAFVKNARGLKIGISVPNKVGKAVVRNKVKRRIRACVHSMLGSLSNAQLVLSARSGAEKLDYREISDCVSRLAEKAGLLNREAQK